MSENKSNDNKELSDNVGSDIGTTLKMISGMRVFCTLPSEAGAVLKLETLATPGVLKATAENGVYLVREGEARLISPAVWDSGPNQAHQAAPAER